MNDDLVQGEPEGTGAEAVRAGGDGGVQPPEVRPPAPQELARELGGDLPCAACRYNLRGLSVRSVCPECGMPVRATILATVDPYASVLRPITWPRATAAGLLLWAAGAMGATLLTWALRLGDVLREFADLETSFRGAARLGAICIALSALGATVLVRPHAGIAVRHRWAAVLGVVASLACAWMYWELHVRFDGSHAPPYLAGDRISMDRSLFRLEFGALMVVSLLGLRPNARLLAGRSLLVRMGHVEHQTLLAMTAAVGVGAIGDVLHLLGPRVHGMMATMAGGIGNVLIAVGSMLLTVGVVGVVVDCVRLAPVVLRPPLSIGRVMGRAGERGMRSTDRGGTTIGGT